MILFLVLPATAQISIFLAGGATTSSWPTVASFETGTGTCSATMIGCETLLTAAHCVCEGVAGEPADECPDGTFILDPVDYSIFIPHAGEFFVRSVDVAPGYEFGVGSDVALLELDFPVRGIVPESINTHSSPVFTTDATIVGYGTMSGSSSDSQIKRQGDIMTSSCDPMNSTIEDDGRHICWTDPSATICLGDSGGPLFADVGEGLTLAGIHSGGAPLCSVGDVSFDSNVFADHVWITSTAGADIGFSACGDGAQVGDLSVVNDNFNDFSLGVDTSTDYMVEVTATTKLLRVALNAEIGTTPNDLDLYVRFGAQASRDDFDCGPQLFNSMEVCEFVDPLVGDWYINVDVFAGGDAEYQVTAVQLPENPAPPSFDEGDFIVTDFRAWEIMHLDDPSGDRRILSSTLAGVGTEPASPEGVILSPDSADILVGNLGQLAVISIDPATGDRGVVSGCSDLAPDGTTCADSVTGGGLDFLGPRFLAFANGLDPDLLVSDRSDPGFAAVVRVDPLNGDRTIVSGCNNSTCTSIKGAGPNFDRPTGIDVENDDGIIVADSFGLVRVNPLLNGERTLMSDFADVGQGPLCTGPGELQIEYSGDIVFVDEIRSLIRVDPVTGIRTVISGCSDAACTSTVGFGPEFTDEVFGLEPLPNDEFLVVDSGLKAVFLVDGASGDRSIVSGCEDAACSSLVGAGTLLTDPVSVVRLPEPGSTAGLLAGGALLVALRRRRRR